MLLLKGKELQRKRLGKAVLVLQREGFSVEEINDLLRDREWREAEYEYRDTYARHRFWRYTSRIEDALIQFGLEHGRWPEHREWRLYNGLPSWNTGVWYGHYRRVEGKPRGDWTRNEEGLWGGVARRAKELTPRLVFTIPNMTLRRIAVENFGGVERLIKKGGGRLIQQDDFGKLWQIDSLWEEKGDRTAHYVEVVNSTPKMKKVDGEYVVDLDKHGKEQFDVYFLRVPPTVWRARDAVAWTGHFERQLPADNPLSMRHFAGFAAQS